VNVLDWDTLLVQNEERSIRNEFQMYEVIIPNCAVHIYAFSYSGSRSRSSLLPVLNLRSAFRYNLTIDLLDKCFAGCRFAFSCAHADAGLDLKRNLRWDSAK
jgi:hypothetical protein